MPDQKYDSSVAQCTRHAPCRMHTHDTRARYRGHNQRMRRYLSTTSNDIHITTFAMPTQQHRPCITRTLLFGGPVNKRRRVAKTPGAAQREGWRQGWRAASRRRRRKGTRTRCAESDGSQRGAKAETALRGRCRGTRELRRARSKSDWRHGRKSPSAR